MICKNRTNQTGVINFAPFLCETIKETAEDGLSEISQKGMKRLKYDLPKDVLKRAKEKLVVLNVARTELIARLDNLLSNTPNLSQKLTIDIRKAKNTLQNGLKQDDLVGALRDIYSKPVRESGSGKVWDHQQEVEQGINSLKKLRETIVDKEMKLYQPNSIEFKQLSKEADALGEMIRKIKEFLDTK